MKKVLMLILIAVIATTMITTLSLVGCKQTTATTTAAEITAAETTAAEITAAETTAAATTTAEKKVFGIVMIDLSNPFFVDMVAGGEDAAKDYGVDLIWKSCDASIEKQIALMENFIEQKVDCLLVNPLDNDALKATIEKASAAGIPTVNMAGSVDAPLNVDTVYNDYEDSKTVAKILANLVGKEGKVALIFGNRGNVVGDLRQNGFNDGMAEFPDIKVIEQPSNWDPATAQKALQDIMAANPDLKGYHCVFEAGTLAAYEYVKSVGKTKEIIVTSNDGIPAGLEAVKNGSFMLTILVGAKRVGYWNVKIGVQLANGDFPKEKVLNLPTHLVMLDALKQKVEEWGYAEGLGSILTPDEATTINEQYREELGPKK